MSQKDRYIPWEELIVWKGDLEDDCTAIWAGLTLRAEWMDGDDWWWAVYDDNGQVDSSGEHDGGWLSGEAARAEAERAARRYLAMREEKSD